MIYEGLDVGGANLRVEFEKWLQVTMIMACSWHVPLTCRMSSLQNITVALSLRLCATCRIQNKHERKAVMNLWICPY